MGLRATRRRRGVKCGAGGGGGGFIPFAKKQDERGKAFGCRKEVLVVE